MSLRRTLVLLQVILVAVGLAVFGVTSYQIYRHSEYQRIEKQLSQVAPMLTMALCNTAPTAFPASANCAPGGLGGPGGSPSPGRSTPADSSATTDVASPGSRETCTGGDRPGVANLPAGSFVQLRGASGQVLASLAVPFTSSTSTCPRPALPASLRLDGATPRTLTVAAVSGTGPFIVRVSSADLLVPGTPGGLSSEPPSSTGPLTGDTLVVALPLNAITSSLHNLAAVDLTVGAVLLGALAVGTFFLVRRNLRPLERMAVTSRAISAGDLTRRAPPSDERSEVGQLGAAFNHMLNGIETAFAERDATEQRLRQFLADASHELRTPLTSIRGYAELWRLGGGSDPEHRGDPGEQIDAATAMARIEEHARRMSGMIEELLLLARLDEARPIQQAPVDLAVVAAEACDDAVALDPGRPVSLDAPEPVIVTGDATHLRRAVANLAVNAVHHTPSGTAIDVGVHAVGGAAVVTVRDYGAGMPDDGLTHAFDRFWQADRSRATGGSGLGLSIVAGVAAEHGGAAFVANAPDGGAVLTLRLPLPPAPTGRAESHR